LITLKEYYDRQSIIGTYELMIIKETWLYKIASTFYHKTPLYQAKVRRDDIRRKIIIENKIKEEQELIDKLFGGSYTVLNGPFRGMGYIGESSCSQLLPKILGSYEEPIQPWIMEVIHSQKYTNIIDIGCAEGYYAVGFAKTLPNCQIIAYDRDKKALEQAALLAKINGVTNIKYFEKCTHEELNNRVTNKTLVFCDIEGAEDELLQPDKAKALINADIIVETHDCFNPGVSDRIVERFHSTHNIVCVIDYPHRMKKYAIPADHYSEEDFKRITDEIRVPGMKYYYLKSVNESH
jgi:precorrin-6B methylase 2